MKGLWFVLLGLVIGAAAAWYAQAARIGELDARALEAERALVTARREGDVWKTSAAAELQRVRDLQQQVSELKAGQGTVTAPPPSAEDTHETREPETRSGPPPENWDLARFKQELHLLGARSIRPRTDPRWKAVVTAAKANGDSAVEFVQKMLESNQELGIHLAITNLAEALGDARVIPQLIERMAKSAEPDLTSALATALARIPGDVQTEVLVKVWNDPEQPQAARRAAIQALGDRAHPEAVRVARGEVEGVAPAFRHIALGKLLIRARDGDFKDPQWRDVFVHALTNADGPKQAGVLLEGLQGYWDKVTVDALIAFGSSEFADPESRARAKILAADIASGKRRPPNAGGRRVKPGPNKRPGMRRRGGGGRRPGGRVPPVEGPEKPEGGDDAESPAPADEGGR